MARRTFSEEVAAFGRVLLTSQPMVLVLVIWLCAAGICIAGVAMFGWSFMR